MLNYKEQLKNKKILILAGASVHIKLVEACKKLDVYTIVTDYLPLEESPCKQIADEAWNLNITDIKKIVEKCKEEKVDGVITGWIDPCQRPYVDICNKLNVPCLGNKMQYFNMTDKRAFKDMCKVNKVGTIPEYTVEQCREGHAEYPLFVKPVDSRGSRGQCVCYNLEELERAYIIASQESSNGEVIIEKYFRGYSEFQVTYFFIDGNPYLIRTVDSFTGSEEQGLEKVVVCAASPSIHTELYIKNAQESVLRMFKNLGIKNGPIFMQGFTKNGEFYFFDPGLRFPGVDYEKIIKRVYNVDLMEYMVIYALTGQMPSGCIPQNMAFLDGNVGVVLFPTLSAGKISEISGIEAIKSMDSTVSYLERALKDDEIGWSFNVSQRLAEIDLVGKDKSAIRETINSIQEKLKVSDYNHDSMIYAPFDVTRLK